MRALASVRKISALNPIHGADKIEVADIDGWKVVVKKDQFSVGQLVCYFEIDSWIPTGLAPFLSNGKTPKVYFGIEGERLRTVKLKGQISQGLVISLQEVFTYLLYKGISPPCVEEHFDLTEVLGILKFEKELPPSVSGFIKSTFPSTIPKTDQDRIQNCFAWIQDKIKYEEIADSWFVTEKVEGSSCTFYLDLDGNFSVCSRNNVLVFDENNSFCKAAASLNIEEKMRGEYLFGFALQGELIGPGIQGNIYGRTEPGFLLFDMYDERYLCFCAPDVTEDWAEMVLGIPHVPVIDRNMSIRNLSIEDLLKLADGQTLVNDDHKPVLREGLVFVNNEDPSISFKVISNAYLLGEK